MSKVLCLLMVVVCAFAAMAQDAKAPNVTEGSLFAHDKDGNELGACPLKSTAVRTEISGFVARVNVRQEFENSYALPIEAVYTFPLSQKGAVDDMTMTIGSRVIRARIMKREEAREAYERAKTEGKTASLLDQERPNIFTQSVANIMRGEKIVVEISYVETLKYEDGAYEFVFPMTIGRRYSPGSVTDTEKVSPPMVASRPGHDISIEVNLNAGVPVEEIRSTSHEIQQVNLSSNRSQITLKNEKTIPNKDFILRYDVTGGKIQDAILTHRDERGGFFTMILQPPDKIASEDRTPKEIVFVLDTSGSMYGFPIDKAKEAMKLSLAGLYPDDTFNLITFAGDTEILFKEPVPATHANLSRAVAFLDSRTGEGGTEMMTAIKAALDPTDSKEHLRIVCFMTDGHVGNEDEIIAEVQRHPKARVFSFGIGSSVNRYLLDKIAEVGRGEAEYVSLTDDGSKAAKKFYERVRTPLLTDLSIDWNGLPVADIYPNKLTDLFSAKPVMVHGRYTKPVNGRAVLRGKVAGQPYSREIMVNFPEAEAANDSLASLWARTRIDDLSSEKLRAENPTKVVEYEKQVTNLALEFRLMSSFTSFVAVEDRVVNQNGQPTKIQVPLAVPEGVDPVTSGAVNGGDITASVMVSGNQARKLKSPSRMRSGNGGGGGGGRTSGGSGNGSGTGVGYGSGSGQGSGSGSGTGNASVAQTTATVNVTAQEVVKISTDEAELNSTVTTREIQSLPTESRAFSSLITLNPSSVPAGSIQLDGASDSDNKFSILGTGPANEAVMGRALVVVEPEYPDTEKPAPTGEVEVSVEIGLDGTVASAKATSGPEALRSVSETAAKLSRFAPSILNGHAVRVTGTLAYKFASDQAWIYIRNMRIGPLTEDDRRTIRLADTMHIWLYDAAMRVNKGIVESSFQESRFVSDGKARVRIELKSRSPQVIKKLKAAGVEIDSDNDNVLRGRIKLERLGKLADVSEVEYVLPLL